MGILDVSTDSKQTKKFQYTHFKPCYPQWFTKGIVSEAKQLDWLLGTNSNESNFLTQTENFKKRLLEREYIETQIETETLAEI